MIRPCTLFLLTLSIFFSCTQDPATQLDRMARKALKDDQGVSVSEFKEIRNFIGANAELKAGFADDSAIETYLDEMAERMSQSGRPLIKYPVTIETGVAADDKYAFYIFFENSLSMDGYLRGKTEFLDAAMHFMTQIRLKGEKINLFYVNKDAYPVVTEFENYLKPERVGEFGQENRGNSEVNRILRIVADTVARHPDRVVVVISDYLYSVKGHKVNEELDLQKHITTLNLSELPHKGCALLILQINSMFNGTYYDFTNNGVQIAEERPIFFWIMGKQEKIIRLVDEYRLRDPKGYVRHLVLIPEQQNVLPYYTILDGTGREGRFQKQARGGGKVYTAIQDPEFSRSDEFRFAVAVDFSKVPVDTTYLNNPANFAIKTNSGDKFKVLRIEPIENIEHNDKDQKGTATHIVVIAAENDRLSVGEQVLSISLERHIPDWVREMSTDNDIGAAGRQDKTFGLSYLVDGAGAAFGYNRESVYFTLPITIKN